MVARGLLGLAIRELPPLDCDLPEAVRLSALVLRGGRGQSHALSFRVRPQEPNPSRPLLRPGYRPTTEGILWHRWRVFRTDRRTCGYYRPFVRNFLRGLSAIDSGAGKLAAGDS